MKNRFNLKTVKIEDLSQLQPNSMYVFFNDHYRGNAGEKIVYTNAENKIHDFAGNYFTYHMHKNMDDRGVISILKIEIEGKNQFEIFSQFAILCRNYVSASNNLKAWKKDLSNFGESRWFKFCAKRSSEKTINKKRAEFLKELDEKNSKSYNDLFDAKASLLEQFSELGIPAILAYNF